MFGKLFEKLTVTHVTGHAEKRRGPVMNADPHSVRSMGSLRGLLRTGFFPHSRKAVSHNRNGFFVWDYAF
jgi:hypothetical protein